MEKPSRFSTTIVLRCSAREVLEYFRRDEDSRDFLYKEATLNPTNPRDKADAFEEKLVAEFETSEYLEQARVQLAELKAQMQAQIKK